MLGRHEVDQTTDYVSVDVVDKLRIALVDALRDLTDADQLVNDAFEFCRATRLTPWAETPLEKEAKTIKDKYVGKEADAFNFVVQIARLVERK